MAISGAAAFGRRIKGTGDRLVSAAAAAAGWRTPEIFSGLALGGLASGDGAKMAALAVPPMTASSQKANATIFMGSHWG